MSLITFLFSIALQASNSISRKVNSPLFRDSLATLFKSLYVFESSSHVTSNTFGKPIGSHTSIFLYFDSSHLVYLNAFHRLSVTKSVSTILTVVPILFNIGIDINV